MSESNYTLPDWENYDVDPVAEGERTALEMARECMELARVWNDKADTDVDGGAYYRSKADRRHRIAMAYVQLAQAEELERIANALESRAGR